MRSFQGPKDVQKQTRQKVSKDPFGKAAEDFASELLRKNGYKILQRNFRSRFGELDIIAQDKDTLVFIEVKARTNRRFGLPEEAVTAGKLWKIKKTAEYYSATHPQLPKKLRIDVVSLELKEGSFPVAKIIKVY